MLSLNRPRHRYIVHYWIIHRCHVKTTLPCAQAVQNMAKTISTFSARHATHGKVLRTVEQHKTYDRYTRHNSTQHNNNTHEKIKSTKNKKKNTEKVQRTTLSGDTCPLWPHLAVMLLRWFLAVCFLMDARQRLGPRRQSCFQRGHELHVVSPHV
jgi:hypothetical protein